jgi:hypothetical protein
MRYEIQRADRDGWRIFWLVSGLIGAAALLALTGCATGNRAVPGNRIVMTIAGQPVSIENPKNTTLKGASLTYISGTNSLVLQIDELVSTNDPEVIGEAYAGQVAVTRAQFEGVGQIADKLIQATKQAGAATATGGVLADGHREGVSREGAKEAKEGPVVSRQSSVVSGLPVEVTAARREQIAEFLRRAQEANRGWGTITNAVAQTP